MQLRVVFSWMMVGIAGCASLTLPSDAIDPLKVYDNVELYRGQVIKTCGRLWDAYPRSEEDDLFLLAERPGQHQSNSKEYGFNVVWMDEDTQGHDGEFRCVTGEVVPCRGWEAYDEALAASDQDRRLGCVFVGAGYQRTIIQTELGTR